jgi:hypothetical protein
VGLLNLLLVCLHRKCAQHRKTEKTDFISLRADLINSGFTAHTLYVYVYITGHILPCLIWKNDQKKGYLMECESGENCESGLK